MNKTLWIAYGGSAQAWYRCAMPATELDEDWVGLVNGPPDDGGVMIAGNVHEMPNPLDYETVIIQLAVGDVWTKAIKRYQKAGIRVLYEVDDYLQGVSRIKDHRFKSAYAPKRVKRYVEAMKICDGIICSTEFLAEQYKKYNNNVYSCKNSIRTKLYDVEDRPEDDSVVIGWAGGAGHLQAFKSWYPALLDVMTTYNNTRFISIGTNYADEVATAFESRSLAMPWTSMENFPYALRAMDVGLAPSHDSKYFRSKSDLRWLEGSAVGIAMVVNPITYPEVIDGVTGLVATTEEEAEEKLELLVKDADLRKEISQNAKKYVQENRDISVGSKQWLKVLQNG